MPDTTSLEKDGNFLAEARATIYGMEAFTDGVSDTKVPLHAKAKHAAWCIQCGPPTAFKDSGLTHIKCALGDCDKCGNYPEPTSEKSLGTSDEKIFFYTYELLNTCTKCGPLQKGKTKCTDCCSPKNNPKKKGHIRKKKHLILKHKSFRLFWNEYYLKQLKSHRLHLWKMIVLSKQYTNDVRDDSLREGEVGIGHDFTEYLKVESNEEIQSKHFGGGTTISIEGYTLTYYKVDDNDLYMDFHSFLSDDKTQTAATVQRHLEKLIKHLFRTKALKEGGRILGMTDGCGKQYKSATSVYFMSLLASKYKIVMDRGICCAGHGKSIVDAINGLDKNAILRLTVRKVGHADKAMEKDSKDIKVFTMVDDAAEGTDSSSDDDDDDGDDDNNDGNSKEKFSPAKECVRLLQQDYRASGLKSMTKRKKRECEKKRFMSDGGIFEN